MDAYLILEDGTVFRGSSIGAKKEVISEIVFNTSMTGYLEVMTDPSYAGQAVVMTYPLIGNYGICPADMESGRPWVDGFIVRELSRVPSNFRSEGSIQQFLEENDIAGIAGIDTRALTKLLRDKGTMNGMITTEQYTDLTEVLPRIKAYSVRGVVMATTTKEAYTVQPQKLPAYAAKALMQPEGFADGTANVVEADVAEKAPSIADLIAAESTAMKRVALLDLGAKKNIVRQLQARGCEVTVYPADTSAETMLAAQPDGIMLSNGPGDPKENVEIIREIKKLYDSDTPIFAICLGHQLMALATGADTYKLKYGHRGGNHPVKDLETGRVYISSQNHGYAVDTASLDPKVAVEAFYNVNDRTNEGLKYLGKNIMTVQYHPEACPGPQDSSYLFDRFMKMMEERTHA